MPLAMTLSSQRGLFEMPRETAYFNAAYMGPFLTAAREAGDAALARRAAPWETTPPDFFAASESVRALAGGLFGATAEHVAIVPSASYGLAAAARNLRPREGEAIVVLADQFPSNVYTWRRLAEACGARLRTVSREPGQGWTEAVIEALDAGAAILAVPQAHWIDGGRLDLEAVSEAARARGAALALDLTQSLGAMPFDAGAVDPDFAVAAAYKWQLGPYATGFLYVAERHWEGVPLEEGWIVRRGAENFAGLTEYVDAYEAGARRFDMGERSNFQLLPMVEAAQRQIADWTPSAIAEALGAFNAGLAERLEAIGLDTSGAPDRAPHYLTAALPEGAPDDLVARLAERGVHISQRGPRLRITPHLNADEADADRLVGALEEILIT